jgi:hypothetical protein
VRRAVLLVCLGLACDKSGPLAELDASGGWTAPASPAFSASSGAVGAAGADGGAAQAQARAMPPRPVPTSNPTVTITMPEQVQLQAIQYMAAMQAPQPGDAPADPAYAKTIADQLRAIGKPEVISSGRKIDVTMPKGCDATVPKQAIARYTGASLTTLLAHGVLVVRCVDREVQCLQSTRDGDDVLCTHK